MDNSYLSSVIKQFEYNKSLGDKTFSQLTQEQLFWQYNKESNSIATIVKHISGNMLSRWMNFLTEDGEKSWRNRDDEFVNTYNSKEEMITDWEKGWQCLFDNLSQITPENSNTIVYIRNEGHTIAEAVNRQLCHYSYHIGQIVVFGKMVKNYDWQTLSIPKNASKSYNEEKIAKNKTKKHFTDDL
jgi:predicted secreted protein